jgi:hypothetical protein
MEDLRKRAGTRNVRTMAAGELDWFHAETFAGDAAAPYGLDGAISGADDGGARD